VEREAFLGRVRVAVGRAVLPEVPLEDPGLLVPDLPAVDLVSHFTAAVERVGGVVHHGDPATIAVDVARSCDATSFLAWDADQLPVPGVVDALVAAGLQRLDSTVPSEGSVEHQLGYFDVTLGVTGAFAGFAESGSIVVASGPGRPRMASLIPSVHVAVLRQADIHRSLAHWADAHPGFMSSHTNVVFISGVSRTGDIEMRLNTGVHGPKHVHIVIV
jgi:L-lactate dehydrogenase complex protein LldG